MIFLNRKVFILTFCSIGCSIHLFTVVNEFLKFPVRTDIIYDYPEKMIVPEIDIILHNIDLLNMTALHLKYPNKMTQICEHFVKISNFEMNSIEDCIKFLKSYYERSYHVGKMLTVDDVEKLDVDSLILNFVAKEVDFVRNDLCSVERYFNAVNTFLRVSCREDSKQIERRLVRNIVIDDGFCVKHNIYHSFGVRFAHPNSSIDAHVLNYLPLERGEGENLFTMLHYREITVESKEWPYQTNCRHYQKSQIFSKCLREKISHSYPGIVQLEDVIQVGQYPSDFKFDDLKYDVNETISQIKSGCAELVKQPQCIEKTYQTQGRSAREKGSGIGLICVGNLIDFNINLKTYPKSTFTELLIYISSILGIWFGISIYGKLIDGFIFPTIPQHSTQKVDVVPNVESTSIHD